MKTITYFLISTALSFPMLAIAKVTDDTVKRFALITASNNGGDNRQTLRYAESDAIAFSKVFEEIGGVKPENRMLLLSPNKQQFLETLKQFRLNIKKNSGTSSRVELIFYYSGHSDEDGLMLFNEKLEYQTLRNKLQAIDVDIRVAILDSCQSGVFTRLKGGVKKAPFMVNNANNIKGNVFLASSSADEAAQESDAIGGSFFTHHLISALRGASDTSGDSQVTLNEAYQYAFHETLAHTEKTLAGAQHAAYNIQLAGAGDLVLTDIQTATTSLVIPEQIIGRIFVRSSSGRLTAELNKLNQSPMIIGLVPDIYQVTLESNDILFQDEINLKTSKTATLVIEDFSPIEKSVHRTRGKTQGNKFDFFGSRFFDWKAKNITTISIGYESFTAYYKADNFGGIEWGQHRNINERYEGYNINILREFNSDYFLDLGRHEVVGFGKITGEHLTINRILFRKTKADGSISFNLGLGMMRETLDGFPSELTNQYKAARTMEDKSVYRYIIPFNIMLKGESTVVSIQTNTIIINSRSTIYRDKPFNAGFKISIGYQL